MHYNNIFFDLDDTLWAFSFNARDTFEEMYRKYEYDRYFRSFDHFYELYEKRNIELWAEYADGKVTKEELNRQRFLYPLEAVGEGDAALAKAFSDDFFAVIPTKSRLMPHAQEVLALPWKPLCFWMQEGIRSAEARALLEPEQILVVEDLCLMVEHARLLTLQK